MGRREKALDPAAGPVQRFAYTLRKLRREAGGPTYRELAGRAGYSPPTLSAAAAGERLPSLPVLLAYVAACGGEAASWERRWREAAAEAAADAARAAPADESPYRGLARYGTEDAGLFFGRDALAGELAALVREHRCTAVVGASGSGKSSLLRAGLVPRLTDAAGVAAVRILTPGAHPARTHAARLAPAAGEGDTVVLVDQFEEVFSLCRDAAERAAFLAALRAAAEPGSRLRVVLSVRADFFARLLADRRLAEAVRPATLPVGPMSPAQLREAVVGPAAADTLVVERALTARLVADVADEPGGLPLLSHALLELWRRRRGRTLALAAYEEIGGVQGAIAHTAEEVYAALGPGHATVAQAMLLRLIAPGDGTPDTRRPAERAELVRSAEAAEVLERLLRARLLTADGTAVELAHEALITGWPRLAGWVGAHRERLRLHRRLTEAAGAWAALERDPGALYRGVRLAGAREEFAAADADLTPLEREFLDASVAEDERRVRAAARTTRRLRALTVSLAVLLSLAVVAGLLAWQQSRVSARQRDEAEARRIAALAAELGYAQPRTALRLSVAAWKLADLPETRAALAAATAQPEQGVFDEPTREEIEDVWSRYTADHRTFQRISPGETRRWDTATGRRLPSYPGYGRGTDRVEDISPDGRTAVLAEGRRLRMWDLREGRTVGAPFGHSGNDTLSFSPDGDLLVLDGSQDAGMRSIQVWEAGGDLLFEIPERRHAKRYPAVSPDGRWLAWCPLEGRPEVWDIRERRRLRTEFTPAVPAGICGSEEMQFTPDGRGLAFTTYGGVRTWDARSGRERPRLRGEEVFDAVFSADGTYAATFDRGAEEILLWRTAVGREPLLRYPLGGTSSEIGDLALDTEQGVLRYTEGSMPGGVLRTLSLAGLLDGHWQQERLKAAEFDPAGDTLATTSTAGPRRAVQLRDGATGQVGKTLRDTELTELYGSDHTVRIRDGRQDRGGDALAVSPDGTWALTDTNMRVDTRTGRISHGLYQEDWPSAAVFSRDGRFLAVADSNGRTTLWNGSGRRLLAVLAPAAANPRLMHPGEDGEWYTPALAFSRDGRTVAMGDTDGTLRLWQTDSPGDRPAVLPPVEGPVLALSFAEGDTELRAAAPHTPLRRRTLEPERWARAVCARADGGLTAAQWRTHLPDVPYRRTC